MASLTDKRIKNTYDGLLKTTDNDALGGSYKLITDGLGNSSNVYLGTGGAVGIGRSAPRGKFDVYGDFYVTTPNGIDYLEITDTNVKIGDGEDANGFAFLHLDSQVFKFITDSAEVMRITSSGNVGIGTDSPGSLLHLQSASPKIQFTDTTTNASSYIDADSGFGSINIMADHGNNVAGSQINLLIDGTSKMVIKNTGNVGIGTTNPSQKLDVSGRIRASHNTSNYYEIGASSAGGFVVGKSGGVETVNIRTYGDSHFTGGNVGIGTTSPARNLHIHQNDSTLSYLQITNSTTGTTGSDGVSFGITSDEIAVWNNRENTDTTISTNNTERLRITSAGNVGIGTSSPTHLLHVAGSVNIEDDLTFGIGGFLGTSSVDFTMFSLGDLIYNADSNNNGNSNHIFKESGNELMRIDSSGNVGIGTTSPGQKITIDQGVGNVNQGIPATSGSSQNGILRLQPGGPYGESFDFGMNVSTTYAWIQPTNKSNHSVNYNLSLNPNGGNVGIGTTSPGEKLDVSGNIALSGNIVDTNTNESIHIGVNDVWFEGKHTHSAFGVWSRSPGNGQRKMGIDGGTSYMGLYTNSTEKVRIDANGNVGIGTTSPDQKLTINGGTESFGLQVSESDRMTMGADGDWNYIKGKSGNGFRFSTFSAGDVLTLTNAGNVGIGTTSPDFNLHINESTANTASYLRFTNAQATTGFDIGVNTSNRAIIYNRENSAMTFATNAIERLRITNGGNVGIGTTSPGVKLDVSGSIKSSGTVVATGSDVSGFQGHGVEIRITGGSGSILSYDRTASQYKPLNIISSQTSFNIGTSEKMRIDSAGNVGIGTTSPYTNFEVVGKGSFGVAGSSNLGVEISSVSAIPAAQVKGYIASATSGAGGGNGDLLIASRTNASTNIRFFAGSTSERMRIDSDGNVGIGTTSPSVVGGTAKMTIDVGSGVKPVSIVNGTTDGMYIRRYSTGGSYQLQTIVGSTNAGNLSLQSYGGKVGIGTTSPNTTLEVGDCDSSANIADGNIAVKTKSNNTAIVIQEQEVGGAEQWGIGVNVDGDLIFTDSGTERIRFDDGTGNVGIGTSSPSEKLHVEGNIQVSGTFPKIVFSDSDNNPDFTLIGANGKFRVFDDTNDVDRFIIDSSGNVLIGTTSTNVYLNTTANDGGVSIMKDNAGVRMDVARDSTCYTANRPSTTGAIFDFRQAANAVGNISVSTVGTSYNTSSDYRLKENVVDMTGALDRIEQLQPKRFNFISDAETTVDGFIAHEVQSVIPEAITGEKDAVDDEGNAEYQGIDQSKIVPLLVGAIKELKTEIQTLKSQINS